MSTAYYELIIKGNDEILVAYLEGFFYGRGIRKGWLYSKDHPFHLHHVRERLKFHGEVLHFMCEPKLRPTVLAAIKNAPPDYEFEVKDVQRIKKAEFAFKFKTFSRDAARAIKRLLGAQVEGTKMIDLDVAENVNPEARGAEVYAPLHDYCLEGKGVVSGRVAGVLKAHEKLCANEFFNCEDITIHH